MGMIGADGLIWTITWKSAIAATPSRITFSKQPQLNFDIPSERGNQISFPFDSVNGPQIDSMSSLSQTSLGLANSNIEASFTGRCGNLFDFNFEEASSQPAYMKNVYFLEFEAKNKDQFNQQNSIVNNPMSFFYEDGRFVQQIEVPIFWGVIHSKYDTVIDLGPGQTKTGYLLSTGYGATYSSTYLPPIVAFWDTSSQQEFKFRFFDTNECPNF